MPRESTTKHHWAIFTFATLRIYRCSKTRAYRRLLDALLHQGDAVACRGLRATSAGACVVGIRSRLNPCWCEFFHRRPDGYMKC